MVSFPVSSQTLKNLTPDQAVFLLRDLLWAEASRLGIGKNLINVPSAITVGDGGVDAEVRVVNIKNGQGIIKQGYTAYQVKTGSFSLSSTSNINSILCKPHRPKELNTRVKTCLDKGGALVVVLFGWDGPDKKDNELVQKFLDQLVSIDSKYANAQIEVWRANQIIGFLESFPSLRLQILGLYGMQFKTHAEWSRLEDMRLQLQMGAAQESYIQNVRDEIRKDNTPVHIRVIGEPEIGKTRLILEATREKDIAPLVIYFDSPREVWNSGLINRVLLDDDMNYVILIVDECDNSRKAEIWNQLKPVSPRIRLITIYSDPDDSSGSTTYLDPPQLDDVQIGDIIHNYVPPRDQVEQWIPFCSGSPRVAHIIGQNLLENPQNLSQSPDTVDVWNRYLSERSTLDSEMTQKRKRILLWLSLFKRFGFNRPYHKEAEALTQKLVKQGVCTSQEFQETIQYFKQRKILQGDYSLYITPKLLHIWLWTQWWENHSANFDLDSFVVVDEEQILSRDLVDGFGEMFRYAATSKAALNVTDRLLGPDGPFTFDILNTDLGSRFFRSLAEARPAQALRCLNRTLGRAEREKLLTLTEGRRSIVWALEGMAVWRELFADAAYLLLALSEAENETWSNNASGVFVKLFSPAPGPVAPTEASPEERFPVLREAVLSSSKERQLLGLKACKQALETHDFVRYIGTNNLFLGKKPEYWQPKTYEELFDGYRRVWRLLLEELDHMTAEVRNEAIRVLTKSAGGFSSHLILAGMVIEGLRSLSDKPYVDRREILETVITVLRLDKNMPSEIRIQWQDLQAHLVGSDFHSLLLRYVGMSLLEDRVDEQRNPTNPAHTRIEQLARQSIENPPLLTSELLWLSSVEAKNGYIFGHELGQLDANYTLLETLCSALAGADDTGSSYLLGGYLCAIRERDGEQWESLMDDLALREDMVRWIPELTWRSGALSDRAALRILRIAEEGKIEVAAFSLFDYGGAISDLSEAVFHQWIRFLMAQKEAAALSAALGLFHFYYRRTDIPEEMTYQLLTHSVLFGIPLDFHGTTTDEYHWTELSKSFIAQFPHRSIELAKQILETFDSDGALINCPPLQTREVLNAITKHNPVEVWELATTYFNRKVDRKAIKIRTWLRGENLFDRGRTGPISFIPASAIWQWIDQDRVWRARFAAGIIPTVLSHQKDNLCLAREFLSRYGNREEVRNAFTANYVSGGWSGPASVHYNEMRQELLSFREAEIDRNVLRWLDEVLEGLERDIERAYAREEREERLA